MRTLFPANLTYLVPAGSRTEVGLRSLFAKNPEIRFVSLVAVDLGGNDTDEKIPVSAFLRDIQGFLGGAIQTDGSSVVLPGIASLNDGKVDFVTDPSVNWYIDYNWDLADPATGRPIGTLRIPSFLLHGGRRVDSRSVLMRASERLCQKVREYLAIWPDLPISLGFASEDVIEVLPTAATELEFWVRTPGRSVEVEELAASQALQEQYWKRTKANVRSALESALTLLELYGLAPEMGHKEVGGVKARVAGEGYLDDVMEQLEIDWRYAGPLQAADNELLARIAIKEVFRSFGLEVTFKAKPIQGVAGNGEHTHVGLSARLKNGRMVNLFAPADPAGHYLSPLGWGSLFGLLKHWPAVSPLVTATNAAFARLQPGFEAPVCPVGALGRSVSVATRNRTVLIGLVREPGHPAGTRFEVRAPNPHTNTYLALAAFYQAMADGMDYAVGSRKDEETLLVEFNKEAGQKADYLPVERAFRSEEDVFEIYSAEERERLFGSVPATPWETLHVLAANRPARDLLTSGGAFPEEVLDGYVRAMTARWRLELQDKLLTEWFSQVLSCQPKHQDGDEEGNAAWAEVDHLRSTLLRGGLFSRLRSALAAGLDEETSRLQIELSRTVSELNQAYLEYRHWHAVG